MSPFLRAFGNVQVSHKFSFMSNRATHPSLELFLTHSHLVAIGKAPGNIGLYLFPSNQDAAPPWRGGVAERKGESHRRELAEGLQSGRHLMEADGSYTCPDPFRGQTSASGAKHPPTEWQTAGMKRVRLGSMGRIGNREACFFSIPSGPVDLLQSRVADASWQPRNTGHLSLSLSLSLSLPCKISAKH